MGLPVPGGSFVRQHLSVENQLAEIICGLIMVMTFTATVGGTFEGITPNALRIAVLGCIIAWGVVDGATYVLGNLLNRGLRARMMQSLRETPDDPRVVATIDDRLAATFGESLTPEQRAQVRRWVTEIAARLPPEPVTLHRSDWYTGLACFLVVFSAALPVLVPFLLFENSVLALRVSNGLILGMLFAIGWRWAAMVNPSRWKTGLALLGIGVVLVAITIALGG